MLQLRNSTPFPAKMTVIPDRDGVDSLQLVVKGTWHLGQSLEVAAEQVEPFLGDEYWDEPGESSLKYASELHLGKPATDVVLVGQAWAPAGKKVTHIDVLVSVGERKKIVRVFGDRTWKGGLVSASPTDPEPFESMPIVYERAYGGTFEVEPEKVLAEERNPVGIGFLGKKKKKELVGELLPNIEDPAKPMKNPWDRMDPQGFGFIDSSWLPRRSFAGTYDEAWESSRSPFLPQDFDPRFFNAAHPDLVMDGHLTGGEPVSAVNVSPRGPIRFDVPRCPFRVKVDVMGDVTAPPITLQTILIEPDEERVCFTWHTSVTCDKKALKIRQVIVDPAGAAVAGGTL